MASDARRPRIALLTNLPLPGSECRGGVESSAEALIEGLSPHAREFEFHVISVLGDLRADLHTSHKGIDYHFLVPPVDGWLRPRTLLGAFRALPLLQKLRPQVVHVNGATQLAFVALLYDAPRLFTIHGIPKKELAVWQGPGHAGLLMETLLFEIVLRSYQNFVSLTPIPPISLAKECTWTFIPNAVRSQFLSPVGRQSSPRFRILFVGALTRMKGYDTLLDAFSALSSQFPDIVLTAVGEANKDAQASNSPMNKLGSRIQVTGTLGVEKLVGLLDETLLFIMPSLQENSPVAIAEAMARGVPVVATKVGGIPDLVAHKLTGFLLEPGSRDALVQTLQVALRDRTLLASYGEQARSRAIARFSPKVVGDRTAELYRGFVAGEQRR